MVDISIPRPDFEKDRGQVGIETLVVFIAMILVAALAAGVLINTAGFLQNKAASTSHESQQQVSNHVRVIGAVGIVNASTSPHLVSKINLSVMQAPGAEAIDLGGATIRYIGPYGAHTLTYSSSGASSVQGTFGVVGVKDTDNSAPVLNAQEDRFKIVIELSDKTDVVPALQQLKPGHEATLRIVTMAGSQTTFIVDVPQTLSSAEGGEAVSL